MLALCKSTSLELLTLPCRSLSPYSHSELSQDCTQPHASCLRDLEAKPSFRSWLEYGDPKCRDLLEILPPFHRVLGVLSRKMYLLFWAKALSHSQALRQHMSCSQRDKVCTLNHVHLRKLWPSPSILTLLALRLGGALPQSYRGRKRCPIDG